MDMKELVQTLISLILLVFVLAGLRKGIIFLAGQWNLGGVVSFLA